MSDDKPTFSFAPSGKYTLIASNILSNRFVFFGPDNKQLGILHLTDPMTFEGNATESAEVFLKAVCQKYNDKERELAAHIAQHNEDCETIAHQAELLHVAKVRREQLEAERDDLLCEKDRAEAALARCGELEKESKRLHELIPLECCMGSNANCYGPRGCLVRAQQANSTPQDLLLKRAERAEAALAQANERGENLHAKCRELVGAVIAANERAAKAEQEGRGRLRLER